MLLEQIQLLRGGTRHLADLALHSAGSLTPEELGAANESLTLARADLLKVADALAEFTPVGLRTGKNMLAGCEALRRAGV